METATLMEILMRVKEDVLEKKKYIGSCKHDDFDEAYGKYCEAKLAVEISSKFAAINFKLTDGVTDDKTEYGKMYWKWAKVSAALVRGSHKDVLSKHWGSLIHKYSAQKEAADDV